MNEGEVVLFEVSGWNDLLVAIVFCLPLVEFGGVELGEVVLDLGLVLEWSHMNAIYVADLLFIMLRAL